MTRGSAPSPAHDDILRILHRHLTQFGNRDIDAIASKSRFRAPRLGPGLGCGRQLQRGVERGPGFGQVRHEIVDHAEMILDLGVMLRRSF